MNHWAKLLETARHAPSPHNVQPWRLRPVSDDEAELCIEKRRTLPKEDVTGSFIILTMAMFIETLDLVARLHGLRVDAALVHEPAWYSARHLATIHDAILPFAHLSLRSSTEPAPFTEDLFRARRTSRLRLAPDPVPAEAVQALQDVARRWGHRYSQVENSAVIERLLKCNTAAVFEDLNTPDYHDEIASWFRFTDRTARRSRDGLDHRCMNVAGLELWAVTRAPGLLRLPIATGLLAKRYRRQIGPVPTLGVLAGGFWKPDEAFEAGRLLIWFWLETARRGLYIHPFGNLVTNPRAAATCKTMIGLDDIWLVFKIGRCSEPPASYRLSVEEILLA